MSVNNKSKKELQKSSNRWKRKYEELEAKQSPGSKHIRKLEKENKRLQQQLTKAQDDYQKLEKMFEELKNEK